MNLSFTAPFLLLFFSAPRLFAYPDVSTPQECARSCRDGEKPKTCYYKFILEHYTLNGLACYLNLPECIQTDGYEKGALTINRSLPGPIIEVCEFDNVVVDLDNRADGVETTIHWHGIFQKNYQYYDGVPMVTQCPIHGGNTFRYSFTLNNAGTHFYHSHLALQIIEGMYGALIVRQSPSRDVHYKLYDVDIYVLMISDIMHSCVYDHYPGEVTLPGQTPDNLLINGRGHWDASTNKVTNVSMPTFSLIPGKRYRFRTINSMSTVCLAELSVEGHRLLLIAQDGEPMVPQTVDKIVTASGERVDFIITADQKPQDYWIKINGLGECAERNIFQLAKLTYVGSSEDSSLTAMPSYDTSFNNGVIYNPEDISDCGTSDLKLCVSQTRSVGNSNWKIVNGVSDRIAISFGFEIFYDESRVFGRNKYERFYIPPGNVSYSSTMNNVSYVDPSAPPISQTEGFVRPVTQCRGYCKGFNYYTIERGAVIEILLYDNHNITVLHHPFHLHGYAFHVCKEGLLETVPPTQKELQRILQENKLAIYNRQRECSPKKDSAIVSAGGYIILRFKADNPGWWLFHCHFLWHTVTGMDAVFHVGTNYDLPPIPDGFPTCGDFVPAPVFYNTQDNGNF